MILAQKEGSGRLVNNSDYTTYLGMLAYLKA